MTSSAACSLKGRLDKSCLTLYTGFWRWYAFGRDTMFAFNEADVRATWPNEGWRGGAFFAAGAVVKADDKCVEFARCGEPTHGIGRLTMA